MFKLQKHHQPLVLLILLALSNAFVLFTQFSPLRIAAGVLLIFALPGWAWLLGVNWLNAKDWLERVALVAGLSSSLFAAIMLGAVYIPGPITLNLTLLAVDSVILAGILFSWVRTLRLPADAAYWHFDISLAVLVLILLVGGYLRFATLGYGEFHEDELENMRLAVRAAAGQEFAPFLDSKGPVHWFFPLGMWFFNGWLNETIARLSVAIASFMTIIAVYLWGRRMVNPAVGLTAAALVAINGFFIAFGRHVENPALIIFWGVLAARATYEFYLTKNHFQLIFGAFLLAIALVAHPDVLLYLPPFGITIAFAYWHRRVLWRQTWKPALFSISVFVIIVAAFYIPYLNDPNLQYTKEYLASERIGVQVLYNSLINMFEYDRNYSTWYYAPLLICFSGIAIVSQLLKYKQYGKWIAIIFGIAAISTVFIPQMWEWGTINGAFLPYALLLIILVLLPRVSFEIKVLTLWFGVPFLALEFLAQDAAMHIQDAYPAWLLLTAIGFQQYWGKLKQFRYRRVLKKATVLTLVAWVGLILYYQNLQFLATVTTYRAHEADAKFNVDSIYRIVYGGLPRPRKLVSNPRLGGWKVIGELYDRGLLQGDFRSQHESFAVPIWYTHQTPRSCFTDPQNYFISLQGRERPEALDTLPQQGYGLTGIVQIDRKTDMIYIYEKGKISLEEPPIYQVDDYRISFDRAATLQHFTQGHTGEYPLNLNFGDRLQLLGYDISNSSVKPGETLSVNLYWRSLSPMDVRYRAFVHIETNKMWGQNDDDPVCRVRTDEWRPQLVGKGQFRVTLKPETPPGVYPITVGVYNPETWERLEITNQSGESLGSILELGTITVE